MKTNDSTVYRMVMEDGLSCVQVAKTLGVNKRTVSRHLKSKLSSIPHKVPAKPVPTESPSHATVPTIDEIFHLPNVDIAQQVIAEQLGCQTQWEIRRQAPTKQHLEVFFLLHPDYVGLPQEEAAYLLGMNQSRISQIFHLLCKWFPEIRIPSAKTRHLGERKLFQFTPNYHDYEALRKF